MDDFMGTFEKGLFVNAKHAILFLYEWDARTKQPSF